MKSKFATIDLCAVIHDLNKLKSTRVVNVYDINSKTYLIKLQKQKFKAFILFESGIRIHQTSFDWPKSMFPSSFSMKFRKHINQKRLIAVTQVGMDRIIDLQFGEEERSCHVIVELYDRGNIILTDHEYIILNILRSRTDQDTDVRFSVKEKYPIACARQESFLPSIENILLFLENGKDGELLKRALVKHIPFGSLMLDHCLIAIGFPANAQIGTHIPKSQEGAQKVLEALELAEKILESIKANPCCGYIAYTTAILQNGTTVDCYQEYYPFNFCQFQLPDSIFQVVEFSVFSEAVDKFYFSMESQKAQRKLVHVEKETSRRLENIKKDHEQRLKALEDVQIIQERRGEYIQYNRELVDEALVLIRTALASKSSWEEISEWLEKCAKAGVNAAKFIVNLDLSSNAITLRLSNPYSALEKNETNQIYDYLNVEIDINLSADQNVRKYFKNRRTAMDKQQKTLAASNKALKSAQFQVKSKINQVHVKTNSIRTRKTFWFENFYWFISSDSYLVVAGRDAQQNELLVKRYFRPGDIYVHADIQGAASVVIRNRVKVTSSGNIPPPRTLNEAGTMAICYSTAWEAKVVVSSWWVRHDQVSRSAQTGEYLPTGSFMIRGKKNFLPTSQLQLGFGLLFRLDEESLQRRKEESEIELKTTKTIKHQDEHSVIKNNELESIDEDCEFFFNLIDSNNKNNTNTNVDEFPDINLNLSSIKMVDVAFKSKNNSYSTALDDSNADDYFMINLNHVPAVNKTGTQKYLESKAQQNKEELKRKSQDIKNNVRVETNHPLTKHQKHKLKKINQKYKDQDDEEREIRLALLGSAGKKKVEDDKKEKLRMAQVEKKSSYFGDSHNSECNTTNLSTANTVLTVPKSKVFQQNELSIEDESEEHTQEDEISIIDSLSNFPLCNDALLYVLPVCGPYSAMQKFKYKVKITPGTGKRGKAVKLATSLFLRDKLASSAELVLIKNLTMDDHVASCVPGKVRVSAPMLLNKKTK